MCGSLNHNHSNMQTPKQNPLQLSDALWSHRRVFSRRTTRSSDGTPSKCLLVEDLTSRWSPKIIHFSNFVTHLTRASAKAVHKQTGIFGAIDCNVRVSVLFFFFSFLSLGERRTFPKVHGVPLIFSLAMSQRLWWSGGLRRCKMSQFGANMPLHVRRLGETTASRQTLELCWRKTANGEENSETLWNLSRWR